VNGTAFSLEKKNAVAFSFTAEKKLAPSPDGPGSLEFGGGNCKMTAKTHQIGDTDNDAPPAPATMSAQAAGKFARQLRLSCGRSEHAFSHKRLKKGFRKIAHRNGPEHARAGAFRRATAAFYNKRALFDKRICGARAANRKNPRRSGESTSDPEME
jgi:hypothetical protein